MREFIISTESNCDLSEDYIKENDICVIPHYYTVDEEVFGDGKELTCKEFYDEMRNLKKVGTMASNSDTKIIVVDTLAASLGEGLLIMKAVQMKKEGKTLTETAKAVEELVPHICTLFTVDDLNYLYRGGRLSKTSAVVGTLVNLKPILRVNEEGRLVALSKTRGRNKSLQTMANLMDEYLGEFRDKQFTIGLIHGDCEEDALYLQKIIEEKYGYNNFLIRPIGPSIGAHSGPGTVGLIFLGDHR